MTFYTNQTWKTECYIMKCYTKPLFIWQTLRRFWRTVELFPCSRIFLMRIIVCSIAPLTMYWYIINYLCICKSVTCFCFTRNCPDYDLCAKCEQIESIHNSSHVFLKLRYPDVGIGRKHGVMIPLLNDIIYKSKDVKQ